MKNNNFLFALFFTVCSLFSVQAIYANADLQLTTSETAVTLDVLGNLTIFDINSGTSNDSLTLTIDGTNLRITDPNQTFRVSGIGVSLVNIHTVDVALCSFTGDLIINTKSGNDVLNLDADLTLRGSHKIEIHGVTTLNHNARISYVDGIVDYQVERDINFSKSSELNGNGSGDVIFTAGNTITIEGNIQNSIANEINLHTENFIASTLDVADADYLDDDNLYFADDSEMSVENFDTHTRKNGDVFLNAKRIDQKGRIKAANIELRTTGNNPYALVINHEGVSRATGTVNQKGHIILSGGDQGEVRISGTLDATAEENVVGGKIHILGQKVGLFNNAVIDVSGENAGTVLLGGDTKGQNDLIQNAEFAYVSQDAMIKADGGSKGNGGKIIVFAKNTTTVLGTISAKGGRQYGDGGFIETSGLKGFSIDKAPDASATNGESGEWLIDPYNITVSNAGNSNISGASPFTASASGANLSIPTLLAGLSNGDVTISTTGGGTDSGNITIANRIDLSGTSGSNSLTLEAHNDININDSVTGTGINKLQDLNLFADTDNDGAGDVNINSSGATNMRIGTLNIDVLGNVNIDGNARNVTITADTSFGFGGNIVINAGGGFNVGSVANKLDNDFEMVSAATGFSGTDESVQIISDTFSVYADGDFKLRDGAFVNSGKEIRSSSSQLVDVHNVLLQGAGNAGAILRLTGAGSQTVNASGTVTLLAGSGAVAIIDTQNTNSSQTINSVGSLLINFSSDDAYIQTAGSQNITVGTLALPRELVIAGATGPTNNGRIQGGAGSQNITVHGKLNLIKGNVIGGSGTTTVTTDWFQFTQGLVDLNTGTFTINSAAIASTIDGVFNSQFSNATIVNAIGSIINHNAGSFILSNSTFNNQGTLNNQGGTLQLDISTLNNNATVSLSGGAFDLNGSNFVNAGTFNWSGSGTNIDLDSGSSFTNNVSSTINDTASSNFTSPASSFVNNGTYHKTLNTTIFNTNFENAGTVTSGGGTTLQIDGNLTSNGNFDLESRLDVAGNVLLNAGILNTTADVTVAGNWTTLAGVSTNMATSGGQLILDGSALQAVTQNGVAVGNIIVNNTGAAIPTVSWNDAIASQSTVTLNDGAVSLAAGGSVANNLAINAASTLSTTLQINSQSDFDELVVGGILDLNGIDLEVILGFTPMSGDRFKIITHGGTTGNFRTFTLPNSYTWDVEFNTNDITLEVIGNTTPTAQTLIGATTITCPQDNTLTLQNSETNFNYFLRNNATNAIIGTAQTGTASALNFQTGVVSETTDFHVFAANPSYALDFDGVDDYVEIPHDNSLNFSTGLTIEGWVYPTNITNGFQEIFRKDNAGTGRILFSFQNNGTILSFGTHTTTDGYTELDVAINPADYNNQWVHVLAFFDDATNAMRIYRNGVEIGNKASNGTLITPPAPSAAYMGSWNGTGEFFEGKIASLRVWNTAPSNQEEVDKILLEGQANLFTGNETGLVAYYPFYENAGTQLTDVTSNTNTGTINGATWDTGTTGGVGAIASNVQTITFNAAPTIVYVDATATGTNCGDSWANALTNIQDAVNKVATNGQILIAAGTYQQGSEITINKALIIKGGYPTGGGTQDIATHTTILDGNNSHRVLNATHTNGTLQLEGFIIQNGRVLIFDGSVRGGGIQSTGDINLDFVIVQNNLASSSSPVDTFSFPVSSFGGGIYTSSGNITLTNSLVQNNLATSSSASSANASGGGIFTISGSITLINSGVIGNSVSADGSAFVSGGGIRGTTILQNSVLWGNTPNEHQFGSLTTSYSLIKDQDLSSTNGIDATVGGFNPLFVDEANGDYRLQTGSPLINAGNDSYNSTTIDLDGNPRFEGTIDIGPYEFENTTLSSVNFIPEPNFGIYPNPFTTAIIINGLTNETPVKIYTLSGILVNETLLSPQNSIITLADLASGMYLIKIGDLGYKVVKR